MRAGMFGIWIVTDGPPGPAFLSPKSTSWTSLPRATLTTGPMGLAGVEPNTPGADGASEAGLPGTVRRWKRDTSAPVEKLPRASSGRVSAAASIAFSALGSSGTLTLPSAIAWRAAETPLGQALLEGAGGLAVVGKLKADDWQGRRGVQLEIEDAHDPRRMPKT